MTPSQTVEAYVEAFNEGDWQKMRTLFSTDSEIVGVLGSAPLEQALPIWRELHERMSMRLEIEALVEQGGNVTARLRERGRFVGRFRGFPDLDPTDRNYEVLAMEWFEFRDGAIARRWGVRDSAAIRTQIAG